MTETGTEHTLHWFREQLDRAEGRLATLKPLIIRAGMVLRDYSRDELAEELEAAAGIN
ncbi:hypothetical protein LCGC14_2773790, partial [marine sediment metagenome]